LPITREEWDKGRTQDTLESLIESFLKDNSATAFTTGEIVSALHPMKYESLGDWLGAFSSFYGVNRALENLVKEAKIKSQVVKKPHGTETYYMIA